MVWRVLLILLTIACLQVQVATAGELLVAYGGLNHLERFDAGTGESLGFFGNSPFNAVDMAFDSKGNLYAVDTLHGLLFRYDPLGQLTLLATGFLGANALAINRHDELYIGFDDVDWHTGVEKLEKFDSQGNSLGVLRAGQSFRSLAFDDQGVLYASSAGTRTVRGGIIRFNPDDTFRDMFVQTSIYPRTLAFDQEGTLFALTRGGGVRKFDAFGTEVDRFSASSTSGDMAFAPNGDLHISMAFFAIEQFDPATGEKIGSFPASMEGQGTPLSLVFVPIPEPSSGILLATAAVSILARRRR